MNEELIHKAIEFKIKTAQKILERLPPEASGRIRAFGHLVYESVGTRLNNSKEAPQSAKTQGKVNNIEID